MLFRMPMLGAIGLLTLAGDIDQTNLHMASFSGTLYLGHFAILSHAMPSILVIIIILWLLYRSIRYGYFCFTRDAGNDCLSSLIIGLTSFIVIK